jgi:hypothetical protein
MMRYFVLIGAALFLTAAADRTPAPTPTPIPTATPQPEFQIGITRLADVTAKLGKPNSTQTVSDGTVVVAYVSNRTRVKGATFVPIVGLFAGGAKSRMVVKVFTFGPDDLLRNFTSSDTGVDCNTSIAGANCR